MANPYTEFIGDVVSGRPLRRNLKHTVWQEGYDAKEKEAQDLYEALKRIATKLESWGKGNLSVSEEYTLQEANQAIARWEDK